MPRAVSSLLSRRLIFGASAGIAGAGLIEICAAVFRCGCRAWWSGGAARCNMYMPGPHCPFCVHDRTGYHAALAAILAVQAAVCLWPARMKMRLRFLFAILAFLLVGFAVALAYGWSSGYWS